MLFIVDLLIRAIPFQADLYPHHIGLDTGQQSPPLVVFNIKAKLL